MPFIDDFHIIIKKNVFMEYSDNKFSEINVNLTKKFIINPSTFKLEKKNEEHNNVTNFTFINIRSIDVTFSGNFTS